MKAWTIKPATTRDLANLYGVSYRIFKNHLDSIESLIGKRIGYFFTVKQILTIFEKIGPPPFVKIIYT